jgi:hypothetical protein
MVNTPLSDDEIAVLARNAGLDLAPAYFAELADAYRHVAPILARVRRGRSYGDEPAQVFTPSRFGPDGA